MPQTITTSIASILNNSTDIASIVGTKIYDEIPENDVNMPLIMFGKSSAEKIGPDTLTLPSTLTKYNIVIDCYTRTIADCDNLMAMTRSLLDGIADLPLQIQGSFWHSEQTSPELQEDDSIAIHGEQYYNVYYGKCFSTEFSYSYC